MGFGLAARSSRYRAAGAGGPAARNTGGAGGSGQSTRPAEGPAIPVAPDARYSRERDPYPARPGGPTVRVAGGGRPVSLRPPPGCNWTTEAGSAPFRPPRPRFAAPWLLPQAGSGYLS